MILNDLKIVGDEQHGEPMRALKAPVAAGSAARPSGSSPEAGSSAISAGGSQASAAHIIRRLLLKPLSLETSIPPISRTIRTVEEEEGQEARELEWRVGGADVIEEGLQLLVPINKQNRMPSGAHQA